MRNNKVGIIVPSSNTVLEPLVGKIAPLIGLDVYFTRVSVSHIDTSDHSQNQFAISRFLEAARLLTEAEVDVLAWGGTSGGWLGREWDENVCHSITQETGIPAITATGAQLAAFEAYQVKQVGLLVPYIESLVHPIKSNFSKAGFSVASEIHLNLTVNMHFAQIDGAVIRSSLEQLAGKADAVSAFCTNLAAACYVEEVEKERGVIVFDSVLVFIWGLCQATGIRDSIPGWGRLLRDNPAFPSSVPSRHRH